MENSLTQRLKYLMILIILVFVIITGIYYISRIISVQGNLADKLTDIWCGFMENCELKEANSLGLISVYVKDVIDGDTIKVVMPDGMEETVRLVGIDAPEIGSVNIAGECYSKEAYDYLQSHIGQKNIYLKPDSIQPDRDIFSRLLRHIQLEDGSVINEEMVREGYAIWYKDYPTDNETLLEIYEITARISEQGLWGLCR